MAAPQANSLHSCRAMHAVSKGTSFVPQEIVTDFHPIAKPHAGSINLVPNVAKDPATGYRVACGRAHTYQMGTVQHTATQLTSSPIACTVQYKARAYFVSTGVNLPRHLAGKRELTTPDQDIGHDRRSRASLVQHSSCANPETRSYILLVRSMSCVLGKHHAAKIHIAPPPLGSTHLSIHQWPSSVGVVL